VEHLEMEIVNVDLTNRQIHTIINYRAATLVKIYYRSIDKFFTGFRYEMGKRDLKNKNEEKKKTTRTARLVTTVQNTKHV
jgi:hypothetical protein